MASLPAVMCRDGTVPPSFPRLLSSEALAHEKLVVKLSGPSRCRETGRRQRHVPWGPGEAHGQEVVQRLIGRKAERAQCLGEALRSAPLRLARAACVRTFVRVCVRVIHVHTHREREGGTRQRRTTALRPWRQCRTRTAEAGRRARRALLWWLVLYAVLPPPSWDGDGVGDVVLQGGLALAAGLSSEATEGGAGRCAAGGSPPSVVGSGLPSSSKKALKTVLCCQAWMKNSCCLGSLMARTSRLPSSEP